MADFGYGYDYHRHDFNYGILLSLLQIISHHAGLNFQSVSNHAIGTSP